MPKLITRTYKNFAGVDFSNDASIVELNRSPDARNVYKNYEATQGKCIETRPGYKKLATIGTIINGMYFFETNSEIRCIVHSATKLYYWSNFPTAPTVSKPLTELYSSMNNVKTKFFTFDNNLYILDGKNYLVYNGTTCIPVSNNAFIPTTSINRKPSGGGTLFQGVNLLQAKRKNTFVGDNTSTDYYLDAVMLDSIDSVVVNGTTKTVGTHYTVNTTTGKVSFTNGNKENAPLTEGQANVVISFTKSISGYVDRIQKCTLAEVFDRRIFFSGNSDYKNALFNSALESPNYVSDLDYYQDGVDSVAIQDIVVANNLIYTFKRSSQQNPTVFYHIPTLDFEYGKIYPSKQGNIATGCYSKAINFSDDVVFMSSTGLEGISSNDFSSENILCHRSTLVDSLLTNENNFGDCELQEWQGYLMCLVDGKIYLADSRQKRKSIEGFEYEWYYWDNIECNGSKARILKEYDRSLYFGCSNGDILEFGGTNDNGEILYAHWETPSDDFGVGNRRKTTNKRGGIAKIKTMPNGQIKVSYKTNRKDYTFVSKYSAKGFSYVDFSYIDFTYVLASDSKILYKIKQRNIHELLLRFYTDELNRPFGVYDAMIEVYTGGYIKN